MKNTLAAIMLALALAAAPGHAQSIWDREHLEDVRASLDQAFYREAYASLCEEADRLLDAEPLSVMMKDRLPASGDMHDYLSLARYFWPDPAKPDGLPYINRDGISNPELEKLDRRRLGLTAERVTTLSLAWYFSGDERYARKATELVRVWFLDEATRMNPNLEYAQMVPGLNGGKGRCYGVLDGYSFVEMLDAVALLESSEAFTDDDSMRLKQWFGELLDWILTSPQGLEEAAQANNHGTAYDAQVIAFALYTGRLETAGSYIRDFPSKRIFRQVEPDGSQPEELWRTLSFGYSQYNLSHYIDVCQMARKLGVSIDAECSPDGRSFEKAMDFMLPYMGEDVSAWPYRQISGWEDKQQEMARDFYRAYLLDPSRTDYLQAWRKVRVLRFGDRFNLLYMRPSGADQVFAFAEGQFRLAMECTEKAKREESNAARRLVSPRSINPDGSLALVHPYDWCSGFFPGSLWQVYEYTRDPYWRRQAISFTWPVEEAKWHGGTHDLGFMVNDSFGRAYAMTGERSYLDVVLQSAATLATRYDERVGCIRSWDHNQDKWKYPVIIDNLMNLELLFEAARFTGDSTYWKIAVSHADVTMKNHFRPDFSSFHVVDYEPETGAVRQKCTAQGFSDDSFWSRGQAWGLYGYTMCYRFTADPAYLRQAEGIADFILSLPDMPEDFVPYWDMKVPGVAGSGSGPAPGVPRDASAAAIIASGLYELSTFVTADKAASYKAAADRITDSLGESYQAAPGDACGFLLLHSTGHLPAGSEIDVPICYADYYYLEAVMRRDAWPQLNL